MGCTKYVEQENDVTMANALCRTMGASLRYGELQIRIWRTQHSILTAHCDGGLTITLVTNEN